MSAPTYQEIQTVLSNAHQLITPAELHGLICGMICHGLKKLDQTAIDDMLMLDAHDHDIDPKTTQVLQTLFTATQTKIQSFELDFQLLLPDEEYVLQDRVSEFAKWCDGFLAGIGLARTPCTYRDEHEVADILHKLGQAAKLPLHNMAFTEEDEAIFFEVLEFVRLAVFAVYQELPGATPAASYDRESDPNYH